MKFTKIITIIAVLIIVTVFSTVVIRRNQRYCGCRISCNSNLKQIGVGLLMYAEDNNGYFPNYDNIKGLKKIIPLLNQTKVLICPKDKKRTLGMINYFLKEANSKERVFQLNGGNEQKIIFLTNEMAELIYASKYIDKNDKPVITNLKLRGEGDE